MINAVFFGTPEFAKHFLDALHNDEEIFVSAIVAQPDKPVGRKKVMTAPPTKQFGNENDIPVYQPTKLRDPEFKKTLTDLNPDVFIVVAYGRIIPIDVLEIPKQGAINVHPSLLPKYRGPSPIQAAIANQETETAVTIMLMDKHMDHGPILAQEPLKIEQHDTTQIMLEKAANLGAPLLVETLNSYVDGSIEPKEQDHDEATFCTMLKKQYGEVDWNESAGAIYAKFRAYQPWPGIFTHWNEKLLKLPSIMPSTDTDNIEPGHVKIVDGKLNIGTGTTPLEIIEIQPEGKPVMDAKSFINGNREIDGQNLLK